MAKQRQKESGINSSEKVVEGRNGETQGERTQLPKKEVIVKNMRRSWNKGGGGKVGCRGRKQDWEKGKGKGTYKKRREGLIFL